MQVNKLSKGLPSKSRGSWSCIQQKRSWSWVGTRNSLLGTMSCKVNSGDVRANIS
jgi:hypothetical protein